MARRFTKIKYNKGNVFVAYEQGANEYSMKCNEMPRAEFVQALIDLQEEVIQMCELPDEYLKRITVKSVSLNYGGKRETMGATITASMELYNSNAPLNLNTPNKPVEPYNNEADYDDEMLEKMCLSEACIEKLNILINEANLYVDGKRAQGSLFDNSAA